MTLLDNIPDSAWFFCFPLSWGVMFITLLGIIHPLCWIPVMNAYRSELFIFMYVLIGVWALLSCALVYGILAESSCIYVFWIWFTLAFGAAMVLLMVVLFCGFCILGRKRKSAFALIALVYYFVTLYFVIVVNKQRKEVFGLQDVDCGECSSNSSTTAATTAATKAETRAATTATTAATTVTTAATTATTMETTVTTATQKTTTMITTTVDTPEVSVSIKTLRAGAMAALVSTDGYDQTTHEAYLVSAVTDEEKTSAIDQPTGPTTHSTWIVDPFRRGMNLEEPNTLRGSEGDRKARLAELLMNSDECRTPHKPAHGWYKVRWRRATLRLKLRCDRGYKENSAATECKYNWWDRPIPQCRKRRKPGPLPLPGSGCIMPSYPEHGTYTVADHASARPGDRVAGENVILLVTCDEQYRAVDPYVVCVGGRWRHAPPSCQKHCRLVIEPTVEYKCFKAFKDKFLACGAWQPDGATVAASCRPGHAHRGPFRYMRCRGVAWDHVVSCLPNVNFTKKARARA